MSDLPSEEFAEAFRRVDVFKDAKGMIEASIVDGIISDLQNELYNNWF